LGACRCCPCPQQLRAVERSKAVRITWAVASPERQILPLMPAGGERGEAAGDAAERKGMPDVDVAEAPKPSLSLRRGCRITRKPTASTPASPTSAV
jgi:hypothetical protein